MQLVLTVAYDKKLVNFSSSGKEVEVRQHQLPQFELVEAKEIDEGSTGRVDEISLS